MASRDKRREENQKLFRLGNERLVAAIGNRVPEAATVPFLCECADEFCNGRVELERNRWREITSVPNQFVVVPGHARIAGEVVIGSLNGYDVVRKPA